MDRDNYYLSEEENLECFEEDIFKDGNIVITPTDVRLENYNNEKDVLEACMNHADEDMLCVFTHEWKIGDDNVKDNLETVCEYAVSNGYSFCWK